MTELLARPKGRASIFRGKAGGQRVAGIITEPAGRLFERRRARLAGMAKRDLGQVSDADVIESMLVGDEATWNAVRGVK